MYCVAVVSSTHTSNQHNALFVLFIPLSFFFCFFMLGLQLLVRQMGVEFAMSTPIFCPMSKVGIWNLGEKKTGLL